MPIQQTALTLIPDWPEKELSVVGVSPAVHEKVAITLLNAATTGGGVPPGLVLRMHSPGNNIAVIHQPWHPLYDTSHPSIPVEYARFPFAEGDVWTVSGTSLTCTLDLNTAALIAMFTNHPYDADVEAVAIVESEPASNLCATGLLKIRNWIINTDDPVLGSSVLKTHVDALEAGLDAETVARAAADSAEEDARIEGIAALTLQVAACATSQDLLQEIADRTEAMQAEAQARQVADNALTDSLDAKATVTALTNEVLARQAAVAAEALTRSNADVVLTQAVAGKASTGALLAEIANRQSAVSAEAQARTDADNALTAAIALKQTTPSAGKVAAVTALADLPAVFTENEMRVILNAAISALRGLYQ